MFTGIIEQIGRVEQNKNGAFSIAAPISFARGLKAGGSVAVNGVCLTVVKVKTKVVIFDVVKETFRCTNLGLLKRGSEVNLEKTLKAEDLLEGHVVLGHVDTVGLVTRYSLLVTKNRILKISLPKKYMRYIVPKGSIAVDGVSFTVVEVGADYFIVAVIPYTFEHTIVRQYTTGVRVNVETDIIGKYVAKACRS